MRIQLLLLMSFMTFSLSSASADTLLDATELSDDAFLQEQQLICAAKDQSSAAALLNTFTACQNVGRLSELLPFKFPLMEWRTNFKSVVKAQDHNHVLYNLLRTYEAQLAHLGDELSHEEQEKLRLKLIELTAQVDVPKLMQLTKIGAFDIESDNAMPELQQNIQVGTLSFSGVDRADKTAGEVSNQLYMIAINGEYYLFNLPL